MAWRSTGVFLTLAILLILGLAAAISVDVVRAGYKVKGDEATYVSMALSLAYDGDLVYQRRDLERFWGLYGQGPEGLFLKRGTRIRAGVKTTPPFIHLDNTEPDPRTDRAYFAKAMIYSVAAAPFVRLFGMNGFLVFHVLMLGAVALCGYLFLAARSQPVLAFAFTLAFITASCVPVYTVFLTPEIFNFACVFVAYFFWAYKEVAHPRDPFLGGVGSDIVAAILLGIATYSKPLLTAPLVIPLVLLPWWRGQLLRGFLVGAVSVAAAGALFGATALITGQFNYQGGDRKQYYSAPAPAPPGRGFLFDTADGTWERRGQSVGTDELGAQDTLKPSEIVRMLRINATYFLFGRHFGFVPYFFPGAVAIVLWIVSRHRLDRWRLAAFAGILVATLVLLVIFPYTWNGGGGPPGNRYFVGVYPAIFFLCPPLTSSVATLLAWIGGAMFTAKMLVNPFASAKFTWEIAERGFARRLPVELTMANDLPVMLLQPQRGNITYSQRDPAVKLYLLDQHAWPHDPDDRPEPDEMWITGGGRADIVVRTDQPLHHLTVTASSPIRTVFHVSAGAQEVVLPLVPGQPMKVDVPVKGKLGCCQRYAYLLSARSTEGFIPRLLDPSSQDNRNLGVRMAFAAVPASPPPSR
jgi:hypothetical protein